MPVIKPAGETEPAVIRPIVSVVVRKRGHLLMVLQGEGRDRNTWNLPGGKVGRGEGLLEAAIRETREETGYEVELRGLTGIYSYLHRDGTPCLRFAYLARAVGGKRRVDGNEILEARWIHLDRVSALSDAELCKPWALRPILLDARKSRWYQLSLVREVHKTAAAIAA